MLELEEATALQDHQGVPKKRPVKGESRPWVSQPLMTQEQAANILLGEVPDRSLWPDYAHLRKSDLKELRERAWERVQLPITPEQ